MEKVVNRAYKTSKANVVRRRIIFPPENNSFYHYTSLGSTGVLAPTERLGFISRYRNAKPGWGLQIRKKIASPGGHLYIKSLRSTTLLGVYSLH
jgi:hypothetical protein